MIYDLAAAALGLLALIIILKVVLGKFPVLSAIDTQRVPEEKESKIKNGLIEKKLKRKAALAGGRMKENLKPILSQGEKKIRGWWKRLLELERKYKDGGRQKPVTLEAKDEQNQKLTELILKAEELKNKELYKEAEKKCIEVISLDAKNVAAYHLLGDIYLAMKDYDHAKEIFRFLIKLNSEDDKALSRLGHIASSLGNLAEARDDLLGSIKLNRQIVTYHLDLAKVYQALDEDSKAIDCCQEALRLEPNNPKNLFQLLQICLETKNKGLALRTLDRLKEANPENQKLKELQKQVDNL